MPRLVYVSVNKSYKPPMTSDELALHAHAAWPISLAKAKEADVLVAVLDGRPLQAWRVLGAYSTDETYETNGGPRPRIAFALGAPVPVDPDWHDAPDLRRGIARKDLGRWIAPSSDRGTA